MFKIKSGFVGHFKTGDNINYNLSCLKGLYDAQRAAPAGKAKVFCKPITILLIAIIEALLHDLFFRIVAFTSEGIKNVAESTLKKIRRKEINQLETYIASAKKYDLLSAIGTGLYQQLDSLRRLRNRIHIQNTKGHHPLSEEYAFTVQQQRIAEQALEKILKISSEKYLRPGYVQDFVEDFELPWNEHFEPVNQDR